MPKILLVEDDPQIASFVRRGLEAEGHVVDHAGGLPGGMERLRAPGAEYDLLIADRMLPSGDGLALCQAARAPGTAAPPVLLLTAEDSVADKVEGLRGGAEDYLAKPFAFNELLARIGVLLRRAAAQRANGAADPRSPDAVQRVGDLALDPASRRVWRGAREVELTAKEFALLAFLMRNAGRAISRTRLLPTFGSTASIRGPRWWTCTSATCAGRSTRARRGRSSTRCAASATAFPRRRRPARTRRTGEAAPRASAGCVRRHGPRPGR